MIFNSYYKDKKSIVLENRKIRAEFIPAPGGKLASFINKETEYEYLLQRCNESYRNQPFGGNFVEGECSGYDDMFPTIDKCNYENIPWQGVEMVDHGEVWSLPWEFEVDSHSLHLSVEGINFPYKIEKHIYFIAPNSLRIDYTLTNYSSYDFEFLWAGHIMLNIEKGTKVEVPKGCAQIVSVLSNGKRSFGEVNNWPFLNDSQGKNYRADIARSKETKGFEKYYFKDKLESGWCVLKYPETKNILKISFSTDVIPYLGILMNEGGWDNLYNIIIEPCTVSYDRPDIAKKYGQVSILKAQGYYKWYITLTI